MTNHLEQIFCILLFYAFGEALSTLIGHFIPGSVLGMILLFAGLKANIVRPHQVENVASFLTKNMGIFFVPAGVGLITQLDLIRDYWIAIVLSMVLSTVLVLAVVAWSEQSMEQRAEKRKRRKEGSL